jgi:hypothetical protein
MFTYSHQSAWENSNYQSFVFLKTFPVTRKKLATTNSVHTCREYFVLSWRNGGIAGKAGLDRDQFRKAYALVTPGNPMSELASSWKVTFEKQMAKSLYIITSLEKKHKWPLTRMYPVKSTGPMITLNMPLMFFQGSRKWTMSPYLMSLWTLMIRMGRNANGWLPDKVMKLKHDEMIAYIADRAKTTALRIGDATQTEKTIGHWDAFMSLYHPLFGNIPRHEHWSNKPLNGHNARPEGIVKLVTKQTFHKELCQKYFTLLKERNIKTF